MPYREFMFNQEFKEKTPINKPLEFNPKADGPAQVEKIIENSRVQRKNPINELLGYNPRADGPAQVN
ncbi:10700_t:CDS:2 [Cetraspora pellucida]|uniref:10700_t:CDS:1 n=1 Tax=Cetraspora pellucida TaxID=1433469 RepID=A0A9N9JPU2_9GLOM|nr:10700_t:CDS:2 [Cetraspora pellucida]